MLNSLLLVEDDKSIQEIISNYFKLKNFEVFLAQQQDEALDILNQNNIDLILLDIMLPKEDGFTICKRIRELYSCPIIFLTAKVSEKDKLKGYAQGGDDYITKPFSLPVLYAKINAIITRSKGENQIIKKGPIKINLIDRVVYYNDIKCHLAPKEYDILLFLIQNEDRIYSREQLLIRFWNYDFDGNERVVDNHIAKLRKALGSGAYLIKTYIKYGWSFSAKQDNE